MKKNKWEHEKNRNNASISEEVPSLILQKIVVPRHQSVVDAVQRKIRYIDKYREKNRKIDRISNKVAKHMSLSMERQQLEICMLLVMKQEDFLSLTQFKKKLELVLHYKKTEFSKYSRQLYRLEQQRHTTKKNIVTTIKAISDLRRQMHHKRNTFEIQLNTLLAQLECDRLASQLDEVSSQKTSYGIVNSWNNPSEPKSLYQQQLHKQMEIEARTKLSKKYLSRIQQENRLCDTKIASMRNILIQKAESIIALMDEKLVNESKQKLADL